MMMQGVDPLWTVKRVAEYFSVEESTVLRWIQEEKKNPGTGMNGNKINNRWRVPQSEVYAYRDRKYAEGDAR
jgi:hypothetical protein